jgi:hypothetical protein
MWNLSQVGQFVSFGDGGAIYGHLFGTKVGDHIYLLDLDLSQFTEAIST